MEKMTLQTRYQWVDLMKVIGMYFIILGHFFTYGCKYIYVFNVPLFFCISGFLFNREKSNKKFWRKVFYNLIVPLLIICTLNFVIRIISEKSCDIVAVRRFVIGLVIGKWNSLGVCWFVYTLIVCKIISQFCRHLFLQLMGGALLLITAFLYNTMDKSQITNPYLMGANAILDVTIAYPFFLFGSFSREYKEKINITKSTPLLWSILAVSLFVIILCGLNNDIVLMCNCYYGSNLLLFLIGGVFGTMFVFSLCKIIDIDCPINSIISRGNIVILGFHLHIVGIIRYFIPVGWGDFLYSLLVLVLFIPIIMLLEIYCPFMLGKFRVQ